MDFSSLSCVDLLLSLAINSLEFQLPPHLQPLETLPHTLHPLTFPTPNFGCYAIHDLLCQLFHPQKLLQQYKHSPLGKKLPTALYLHQTALPSLPAPLRLYEGCGRHLLITRLSLTRDQVESFNLIKFHTDQLKISYLVYPDFDTDPHPSLHRSVQVNLETGELKTLDYSASDNPPILHRKETFVTPEYPHYHTFVQLTQAEEELGLLNSQKVAARSGETAAGQRRHRSIGTRQGWLQYLEECGVIITDHQVQRRVEEKSVPGGSETAIDRHKAAMFRTELSKPVRLALEANLFEAETTFFDYGCGYGGDVQRMQEKGYTSAGWDPYYAQESPPAPADIVNLGYVINVIESLPERRDALIHAWNLTQKVLIVSAQVLIRDPDNHEVIYGDGIITRRNTFQKYYEQEELKSYIDQVLKVDAIPVALGIYFVFRDPVAAETFRATRIRTCLRTPRIRVAVKRFADFQTELEPLMAFFRDRGRLPAPGELPAPQELVLVNEFGSIRRAFNVILQATDVNEWDKIADRRRQDLLVYLGLTHFGERPKLSQLSPALKQDFIKLLGSYKAASTLADLMFFSLSNPRLIAQTCHQSPIGQKSYQTLWVHHSALSELEPLLRLYEGCANRTIGRLDEATIIKFYMNQPQISYLVCPDFDTDPHPRITTVMHIDLRDLQVTYRDYHSDNAPVLYQKEQLVAPDYPLYETFAKLSRQERNWGLLENLEVFQTRRQWLQCLADHCAEIRHHRLYWRRDADPQRLAILKAAFERRRGKS